MHGVHRPSAIGCRLALFAIGLAALSVGSGSASGATLAEPAPANLLMPSIGNPGWKVTSTVRYTKAYRDTAVCETGAAEGHPPSYLVVPGGAHGAQRDFSLTQAVAGGHQYDVADEWVTTTASSADAKRIFSHFRAAVAACNKVYPHTQSWDAPPRIAGISSVALQESVTGGSSPTGVISALAYVKGRTFVRITDLGTFVRGGYESPGSTSTNDNFLGYLGIRSAARIPSK